MILCSEPWCTTIGTECVEVLACVTCTEGESEAQCQARADEKAARWKAGPYPENCSGC